MSLNELTPYLPVAAITAGVLILLWGQRDRLRSLVAGLWPAPKARPEMSPADRFTTFYALRTWCDQSGHTGAVEALDGQVLPTLVRGNTPSEGGPQS